jgi:hypothetical protein
VGFVFYDLRKFLIADSRLEIPGSSGGVGDLEEVRKNFATFVIFRGAENIFHSSHRKVTRCQLRNRLAIRPEKASESYNCTFPSEAGGRWARQKNLGTTDEHR